MKFDSVVEKDIMEFIKEKTKENKTIHLIDLVRYLRECYNCSIRESISILDECIADGCLELKE